MSTGIQKVVLAGQPNKSFEVGVANVSKLEKISFGDGVWLVVQVGPDVKFAVNPLHIRYIEFKDPP